MAEERIRIFIDFWNFQLSWNGYHSSRGKGPKEAKIPWEEVLSNVIV